MNIFLFLQVLLLHGCLSHPNIKVSLLTKPQWSSPSLGLELINLIHDQNHENINIFKIISRLKHEKLLELGSKPKDIYSFFMAHPLNLEYFINQESMDLIKASLALHSGAPKIMAFYHHYQNTVLNGSTIDESCSNWVDWGGKQICDPKDLESASLEAWSSPPQQLLFDIYHKPNSKSARNIAVFYADIHSSEYMAFYNALDALSSTTPDFNFILRFKPPATAGEGIYLSGYGVEMAVKNTEYKAVDDRDVGNEDSEGVSTDDKILQEDSTDALYEEEPSIQKVSKGKIKSIAPLAIAFALGTKDPFNSLVRVSLDFPKVAHLLKANGSSSSVTRLGTQMIKTVTGENQLLLLNGIALDVERFNAFELLRMMKTENDYFSKLESLGLSTGAAFDLVTSTPPSMSNSIDWGDCFNTKSDSTIWINDLERDAMYRQFPKSLYSLVQQGSPNQFKYVRRNIFSALFFVDFTNSAHLNELLKIQNIIRQQAPLRFGVMPVLNAKSSEQERLIALALNEIRKLGETKFFPFINKLSSGAAVDGINPAFVRLAFSEAVGKSLDTTGATSDDGLADIIAVNERLGISKSGAIFGNGRFFPLTSDWTQPLITVYFKMAIYLTDAVMKSKVTDKTDVYEFFMNLPNVYDRRHPAIFPDSSADLDLVTFTNVQAFKMVNWMYSRMGEDRDIAVTTVIAYGDSSDESIIDFFSDSAAAVAKLLNTRLALVDTSEKGCNSEELNRVFEEAADNETVKESLGALKGKCSTPSNISALQASLKLSYKSKGYFVNGRQISLDSVEFSSDDLATLVEYEYSNRINSYSTMVMDALSDQKLERLDLENRILCITSIMSVAKSMVGATGDPIKRQSLAVFSPFEGTKIHFKVGDSNTSKFRFVAAIQPISVTGQKVLGVLDKFKRISGVSIDVYAIGAKQEGGDEKLPLMRFYTFVMDTEPTFTADGKVAPSLALFSKLPTSALLTLGMDVPGAWLVRPKKSVYDLDNIKLSSIPSGRNVEAEFGLEHLLIQGHALDKNTQQPPRGLQFVLGTPKHEAVDESITMANLGYIQLKGAPGVWQMKIRNGRSSEVYKLDSLQSGKLEDSTVILDSFEGVTLHPIVSKRPGMQDADVLVETEPSVVQNVWKSIKANVFNEEKNKTVNVFTVASGHLYERFMAIMMLSVKKHSKHTVKFWLIENFLSPNFLEFLPHLAEAFDFEYELVTYKWPHWLRKQTEKQRIIWGYKILFLDVLFPLSLEKVIFVDADQVVRTDLIELVELDLKGAVYGYTPFCSSRKEMDGFRFWKGGYWENHLAGRPYHISALYVIDLVKFRALAAGDRLRQQYHMLSADPHSLSNLDQDLPNNMIHEIPMFSLPQEWLWCETWCSDESLKTAKTIDLCNNPLTKEPKLERAKRILPEWVGLDDQVAKVRDAFEKGFLSSLPTSSSSSEKTAAPDRDSEHSEL